MRVEPVFGETQEEHLSGFRWNEVTCRIAEVEWPGMSMTLEQVVTQLQQEVFNLLAQLQQKLDLLMQCEQSTISRQPKLGRILRVSLMWKVWDVRRN